MGGGGSSARYADAKPTESANISMNTHGLVDNFYNYHNYDNYNNYDNYIIIIKEIIIFLFIIMLIILLIIFFFKCRKKNKTI
jgi:hypothetical protein